MRNQIEEFGDEKEKKKNHGWGQSRFFIIIIIFRILEY